MMNCF